MKKTNPLINPEFLAEARKIDVGRSEITTKLNLSGFGLKGKAIVSGFPNLQVLNLSINELDNLEINKDSIANLEVIDLGFNNFNSLEFLGQIRLESIKSLILNNNFLKEVKISDFSSMINLTELDLSNLENSVGKRVKDNSVVFDIDKSQNNEFFLRIHQGLNINNAKFDSPKISPGYTNEDFSDQKNKKMRFFHGEKNYEQYFLVSLPTIFVLFLVSNLMTYILKKWMYYKKSQLKLNWKISLVISFISVFSSIITFILLLVLLFYFGNHAFDYNWLTRYLYCFKKIIKTWLI